MTTATVTYVLDTSFLLSVGHKALYAFSDSEVIVPIAVVRELESKRSDPILGFMARGVLRHIEGLRAKHGNGLKDGVEIAPGKTFRIEVNHVDRSALPDSVRSSSTDAGILAVAQNLSKEGRDVVLVTNDLPLRILAQISVGLRAEEFTSPERSQGEYSGVVHATCSNAVMESIFNDGTVLEADLDFDEAPKGSNLGVIVKCGTSSALGTLSNGVFQRLSNRHQHGAIKGRSAEQKVAMEYLFNHDLGVVSLGGRAGTGKTLLALSAGIDQTLEGEYRRVVVFRPLLAVGNQNLGYLPGTEEEKMAPWAAAVYDALDVVVGESRNLIEEITASKQLEVLPVTHIRGRTLTNTFVIIDEAQNLERNVLLSILSRTGANTKVVLCWDAAQSDNLSIGRNDGIVSLVERLKEEPAFAHVTLTKSERSPVAAMASRILEEDA